MFTNNTCCCCHMPLWTGVLIIGLMEFFAGQQLMMLGFQSAGMFLMNSIWFALLFIPSLFYSPQYRKAVLIIYSITTVFSIIGMIAGTAGLAMIMSDNDTFDQLVEEMEFYSGGQFAGAQAMGMTAGISGLSGEMTMAGGSGGGMQPNPMAGDKVAYAHVIAYVLRADMTYEFDRPEDKSPEDWKRERYMGAMWAFQIEMWFSFVFIRCFYNMVLMKFQKEAEWLKQATGEETNASHPCRPLCCGSGSTHK